MEKFFALILESETPVSMDEIHILRVEGDFETELNIPPEDPAGGSLYLINKLASACAGMQANRRSRVPLSS